MLKLVLVGCGNTQRLTEYVHALRGELLHIVQQNGIRIYNAKTLWKAEADSELLKKSSRLCFSTKDDTVVEYWGVTNKDLSDLYSRWFIEKPDYDTDAIRPRQYYTKANLMNLVKEWLYLPVCQKNSAIYDLNIKYQYIKQGVEGKDACIMQLSVNENELFQTPIVLFKDLIVKSDEAFPDVFSSAYVANEEDDFKQHLRYDEAMLGTKILDSGYMLYVSEYIDRINDFNMAENPGQYTANELTNGTLYSYKGKIDELNNLNSSDVVFNKIKIPKYRVFSWSDLCVLRRFTLSIYEIISVCYDPYSPSDPMIVFSYGYTPDRLDILTMTTLGLSKWQKRYNIKEELGL